MKKAIVIGALGFIGFALCQRLLAEEYEVIGIDQGKTGNIEKIQEQKLSEIIRNSNFVFIKNRLEDIELNNLSNKCDVVYYCLQDNDQVYQENSYEKISNIKLRIIRVMEYCLEAECKFIYLSSYEVFKENEHLLTENIVNQPRNLTGKIKAKEENEIQTFSQQESGLSYLILRLPTIYGPWQPESMTYQQLLNGCNLPTIDPIKEDIIYIDDLTELLFTVIQTQLKNKTMLISSHKKNQWQKGFNLLANTANIKEEFKDQKDEILDEVIYEKNSSISRCIKTTIEEGIALQKEHYLYLQKLKGLDLL